MEPSDRIKNDMGIRCEWQPEIYRFEIENKWNRIEGFVVFQFEKYEVWEREKTTPIGTQKQNKIKIYKNKPLLFVYHIIY